MLVGLSLLPSFLDLSDFSLYLLFLLDTLALSGLDFGVAALGASCKA